MGIEFGKLINIVGDVEWRKKHEEKGSLFCRLLLINNIYYAFVSTGSIYYVRGFDEDWKFTGFEKRLTPEGEFDIDQDIAYDGEYIYEYCMRRPPAGPGGQIRKFDKEFNLVKNTQVFRGENDIVLDQNVAVIKGKIYAASEYRENNALWRKLREEEAKRFPGRFPGRQNIPPNPVISRAEHLRIFDADLNLIDERDLVANIKGAAVSHQYWVLGAGQIYADGYYCVIAASHVENKYFRQIYLLRFNDDFNFIDSIGLLSDIKNDNFWCSGLYEDEKYYISYSCRNFLQIAHHQGNICLSVFDKALNELETIDVTNFKIEPNEKQIYPHRSKLLKVGNKIFVTYDVPEKAIVQELILKDK